MKSDFLKKIIAVTVISTTMGTFMPINAAAIDFYTWQQMNSQSGGRWQQLGGNWYFYDYSGVLQTGWIYDKGQWYYADANGIMQKGVVQVGGKIYLFANSGAMQTGNAVINGQYFTFDQNGAATGSNVPAPTKAYGTSGEATLAYTPDQVVKEEDSTPSSPNTVARDPQNLIKYNVKFKDDGDELRTSSVEKDDRITLYTPTKSGYKFVEWNTKKDGEGKSYDPGDLLTVKDDITLHAQWKVATDSTGSDSSNEKVLVEDILVTSTSSSISTKAGTLQMTAKVLPVDASNKSVKWSVQDGTGKATINESSGLLTASANGTVVVAATASDSSAVVGKYSVTISGQVDSGTTPDTGGNNGGDTGGTPTPTGGTITAFDPNVSLADVIISEAGNVVDLPLLKASGKLPTKVKIKSSLSDGSVKEIEIPIADWTGEFDGTGTVPKTSTLTAVLGALPTGYKTTLTLPGPTIKVIVNATQTNNRKKITGEATAPSQINLDSDKHIITTDLLNSAVPEILPKTVTLKDENGDAVVANVKTWSNTTFDGSKGTWDLKATIDVPAGYDLNGTEVTRTLNISIDQTKIIQQLIEVKKGTGFKLNYTQGDKLDLNGLIVSVKYNDGNTGEIEYSDFSRYSITTQFFQDYPLNGVNKFTMYVEFNGKRVYTDMITVSSAVAPTVTASGSTTYDYSKANNDDMVFNYTLGTGAKTADGIKSVSLNSTTLIKDTDYLIGADNTITIDADKLGTYSAANNTPATYTLNVEFTLKGSTTTVKPSVNPTIHFINIPIAPSGIALETDTTKITAKDNTIKLLDLEANVQYEYCVIASDGTLSDSSWTGAKSFSSIYDTESAKYYKELTDTSFAAGKKLYIRKKSISDGKGSTNPASAAQEPPIIILTSNMAKTKSSAKSITKFTVEAEDSKTYEGTITEGSSEGTIKVVLPIGGTADSPAKMSATLTPLITLSDKASTVGDGVSADFSSPVVYTVTAEDGTTRKYTVTVIRTELQPSGIRAYGETTEIRTVGETTETIKHSFSDEYLKNVKLVINTDSNGVVTIKVPNSFDADQVKALERINQYTPYRTSMNLQTAYAGLVFTKPYSTATSVKVAGSLDDLKNGTNVTTIQLSSASMNTLEGQYLEQIPFAKFGTVTSGQWSGFTGSDGTIKYFQWVDANQNILGYTSMLIKSSLM